MTSLDLVHSPSYMTGQREISARTVQNPGDFTRAIPFSGRGVTVVVNDSGVDGTHDDIKFGSHLVQNTQGLTNLAAYDSVLPITYLEGMPNTDLGSGHGTHVAGTIRRDGRQSRTGLYRGVAPAPARWLWLGAVLLLLDAVGGLDYAATTQSPTTSRSGSPAIPGAQRPFEPLNRSTLRPTSSSSEASSASSGRQRRPRREHPQTVRAGAVGYLSRCG